MVKGGQKMSDIVAYGFCENDCKREVFTKEQTLALLQEAIDSGDLASCSGDVKISEIQEINKNAGLKFWVGTQAEYNAIASPSTDVHYIITDDTTLKDLNKAIEDLQKDGSVTTNKIADGAITAQKIAPGAIPAGITHTSHTAEISIADPNGATLTGTINLNRYTTGDDDGGVVIADLNLSIPGGFDFSSAKASQRFATIIGEDSVFAPSMQSKVELEIYKSDTLYGSFALCRNGDGTSGGFDFYVGTTTKNSGTTGGVFRTSVTYYGTPASSL